MSPTTLLLVALGVSADAFAVAVGKGLQMTRLRGRDALALALAFGVFQGLMPVIGWLAGTSFQSRIEDYDHWVAFALLAGIGLRMIWGAVHPGAAEDTRDDTIGTGELFLLATATSIDALAVGIGLAFLDVDIVGAAVVIAITTFVLTLVGVFVGQRAGTRFRTPAEVAGGAILVLIGTKILLDHLGVL